MGAACLLRIRRSIPLLSSTPRGHDRSRPLRSVSSPPTGTRSALAVHGDDLLIATAKGEGTRPNKDMGKTSYEMRHRDHPYIPTLLKGSIARLNIPSTLEKLPQLTQVVEHDNLLHADPGTIAFASGRNPIKHVIYVIKENRTYDQILGDLKSGDMRVGDGDPSHHHVRRRHHSQRAQTGAAVWRARQFLRQRRSFRRRPPLVDRRDHQRLQREDLADCLSRTRNAPTISRARTPTNIRWNTISPTSTILPPDISGTISRATT